MRSKSKSTLTLAFMPPRMPLNDVKVYNRDMYVNGSHNGLEKKKIYSKMSHRILTQFKS